MPDMTCEEYDKHINVIAEFWAHLTHEAVNTPEINADKSIDDLYKAIGAAFMALRRERIEKFGMEPDDE